MAKHAGFLANDQGNLKYNILVFPSSAVGGTLGRPPHTLDCWRTVCMSYVCLKCTYCRQVMGNKVLVKQRMNCLCRLCTKCLDYRAPWRFLLQRYIMFISSDTNQLSFSNRVQTTFNPALAMCIKYYYLSNPSLLTMVKGSLLFILFTDVIFRSLLKCIQTFLNKFPNNNSWGFPVLVSIHFGHYDTLPLTGFWDVLTSLNIQ